MQRVSPFTLAMPLSGVESRVDELFLVCLVGSGPTAMSLEAAPRNLPVCWRFRERKCAMMMLLPFAVKNAASAPMTDREWVAVVAARLLGRLCLDPGKKLYFGVGQMG